MFDKHMAEDEARDAAKGKKKASKEPSAKEKMKLQKALEKKKKAEKKAKLEAIEKKLRDEAKVAGMDYEDYLKEKEDKEDDAMRERCKKAFEEQMAEIEANRPADDGTRKKRPKGDDGGGAPTASAADEGGGEGGGGGDGALTAAAPEVTTPLELGDDAKAERLGKCGKLTVTLSRASGLKAADKGGLSDPYVEAKLGKKSKQSSTQQKTTSPNWADEKLEIATKLSLKKVCKDGLTLVIMDKDTGLMDSDDVLGKVSANLGALEGASEVRFVESVPEGGVIAFSVEWEEGEVVDRASKKKPAAAKMDGTDVEAGEACETTQQL